MVHSTRGRAPGQWWPCDDNATIYCGTCGKPLALNRHTIDAAGNISPSINTDADGQHDAVEGHENCHFHVTARLVGWSDK